MSKYKLLDLSEGECLSMVYYNHKDCGFETDYKWTPSTANGNININVTTAEVIEYDSYSEVLRAVSYYTTLLGKRPEWLEIIEIV